MAGVTRGMVGLMNCACVAGIDYNNLSVVCLCVRPSGKVTGRYLTLVKKLAFFASLSSDLTEVVD